MHASMRRRVISQMKRGTAVNRDLLINIHGRVSPQHSQKGIIVILASSLDDVYLGRATDPYPQARIREALL